MLKLGTQTGSLVNHLLSRTEDRQPQVGDGATELCWSDRHAYTVVEVKSAKTIVVQRDTSTRVDTNGMSESQVYTFARNEFARKATLRQAKNGGWYEGGMKGRRFLIGEREEYHDYSF